MMFWIWLVNISPDWFCKVSKRCFVATTLPPLNSKILPVTFAFNAFAAALFLWMVVPVLSFWFTLVKDSLSVIFPVTTGNPPAKPLLFKMVAASILFLAIVISKLFLSAMLIASGNFKVS